MIQNKDKISFVSNATTKEAFVYSLLYTGVIFRNIGRAINKAVHKLPWVFIIATVAISFILSFVFISKARAERDNYNKENVKLMQQLDSYKAVYGSGKEVY